jgi:hypothetical protein
MSLHLSTEIWSVCADIFGFGLIDDRLGFYSRCRVLGLEANYDPAVGDGLPGQLFILLPARNT